MERDHAWESRACAASGVIIAESADLPVPSTEGPDRLGLRELLQRYADEQCIAVQITPEQTAESVLDCFKRVVW